MPKVIVTMFVSLDGVTEEPQRFSLKFWNDDIAKLKNDELFSSGALLLGRTTYEGFTAAWPSRTGDFADRMNGMSKYVVSKRLKTGAWNNSTVIGSDLSGEVGKLKRGAGGDLLVYGGTTLVDSLLKADLVDEYRLLIYPVVIGGGKRLFKDGAETRLKLVEVKPMGSDVALLTYQPAR